MEHAPAAWLDGEWDFDILEADTDIDPWIDHPEPFGDFAFAPSPSPPRLPPSPPQFITADHFRIARPAQIPLFGTRDFRQGAAAPPGINWPAPPPAPPVLQPPRPIPPASHSENWLDQRAADLPQADQARYDLPAHLYEARFASTDSGSSSPIFPTYDSPPASPRQTHRPLIENQPLHRGSDDAQAAFVALGDSSESESDFIAPNANTMPPTTRNSGRGSVVDLTQGSSSPERPRRQPRSLKRSAEASSSNGQPKKKAKIDMSGIEEVDLANEAPSAEDQLLQAQQKEAIKAQQQESENGPQRIGKKQCCICLENFTNCTATSCGHLFCHECLIQAIIAGEKNSERGTGRCPVCRKTLNRSNAKKRHDIIPISFMKKGTYDEHQRQQRYS